MRPKEKRKTMNGLSDDESQKEKRKAMDGGIKSQKRDT